MIVVGAHGHTDAVVDHAVGDGPVAARVFTGDEFGIDDAFLVPFGSDLQGFLVLFGGGRIGGFAVDQLEVAVVGAAVAGAGVHAVSAPQRAQTVGGHAVGVGNTVAVGIIEGEGLQHFMEFVQGGGDGEAQLVQPGLVVHHGQMEDVAGGHGGDAVLLAVHNAVIPEGAFLEFINGGDDAGGHLAQHVHIDHAQFAGIHIADELAGVLQADDVGGLARHDVGVQHFVERAVVNGEHVDVHVEFLFHELDEVGIFFGERGEIGGPGDLELVFGGPVDFLCGSGGDHQRGEQHGERQYQSQGLTHREFLLFNICSRRAYQLFLKPFFGRASTTDG